MQRDKEDSADYRYFPCPDLVPVILTENEIEAAKTLASKTPATVRKSLIEKHLLKPSEAEVLVQQGRAVIEYFESLVEQGASPKRATSWMLQDVLRYLNENSTEINSYPVSATSLAKLLVAIETGKLDTTKGKEALGKLVAVPNLSVEQAIESLGIAQVDANELETLCKQLLAENPEVIEKFRAGNEKAIASLVGPAKKINKNVDPRQVQETCRRLIQSATI